MSYALGKLFGAVGRGVSTVGEQYRGLHEDNIERNRREARQYIEDKRYEDEQERERLRHEASIAEAIRKSNEATQKLGFDYQTSGYSPEFSTGEDGRMSIMGVGDYNPNTDSTVLSDRERAIAWARANRSGAAASAREPNYRRQIAGSATDAMAGHNSAIRGQHQRALTAHSTSSDPEVFNRPAPVMPDTLTSPTDEMWRNPRLAASIPPDSLDVWKRQMTDARDTYNRAMGTEIQGAAQAPAPPFRPQYTPPWNNSNRFPMAPEDEDSKMLNDPGFLEWYNQQNLRRQ
jgi:hypothetical protein